MSLSRDELAARCLVSLLTRDGYDGDGAARDAVVAADALLSALAQKHDEATPPAPAPTVAPLTEEEREGLAGAVGAAMDAYVKNDGRTLECVAADASAAWFQRRGSAS